ncbi:protein NUCLEAR FUSION DEFECTIVE 4-like [Vicia villosa]|uniref:protein NUCLEAR FUSION DEFECTIVE 4-like n=1 Tax=Vicia villosa TaxID=3911 RepID=UPI00273CD82B|nr:protein NUCLEAR FUSION DEFECTIVE 4-like [Vicia villosa]
MSYTVLGVYLCVIKVFHHFFPLRAPVSYIVVVMILILLMAPAGVVAKMWWNTSSRIVLINEQEQEDDIVPVSLSHNAHSSAAEIERQHRVQEDEDDVSLSNNPRNPILGDEFNFIDAIVNADFWLLILVYFVGVGSAATVSNNLAQIGISQGVEDTTTLVSLFSLCNSVGRASGGLVSEHFIRTMYIPRTVWMTCTQTMMIVIYTLLAFSVQRFLLYVSVAFLGICYGMHVSIMISTVSELFGLKNLGLFSHIMMLGNPIGSIILSLLQGSTYDKEAAKQLGLNLIDISEIEMYMLFWYYDGSCIMTGRNDAAIIVALVAVFQAMQNQPNVGIIDESCSLSTFQRENLPTLRGQYDPDGAQE